MHWYLHKKLGATHKPLDLNCPSTFNEKINWLKVYHRFQGGHLLADKFTVRDFVTKTIGEQYLVPILGVYEEAEAIDFDSLPSSFVMKATHGSGWNIVCDDKSSLDQDAARRRLSEWLKYNYYYAGREWQYRDCKPRIICEEYLGGVSGPPLLDYKFFCFHGVPLYIQVDIDRYTKHTRNFYDVRWKRQPFSVLFPQSTREVEMPSQLDTMLDIARRLSAEMAFSRVDLYYQDGRILFGEITFHPGGGCEPFFPPEYDLKLGELLTLPDQSS
jgi:hypothetical protein